MARTGISNDFELDDHGILRDSFASDFHVDDDGILQDNHIFKHGVLNGAGHGTDSGFGGDKQSSSSTLQHLHTSFDEDLAPIGDESINISDFEASRDDDLDSVDGDHDGSKKSRSHAIKDLDTPGNTLERPMDLSAQLGSSSGARFEQVKHRGGGGKGQENLFSEEYYQQLRELGVVFDGEDFSREESQQEFEALGAHMSREHINDFEDDENRDLIGEYLLVEYEREREEYDEDGEYGKHPGRKPHPVPNSRASSAPTISGRSFPEISPEDAELMYAGSQATGDEDEIILINHRLLPSSHIHAQKLPVTPSQSRPSSRGSLAQSPAQSIDGQTTPLPLQPTPAYGDVRSRRDKQEVLKPGSNVFKVRPVSVASQASAVSESPLHFESGSSSPGKSAMLKAKSQESFFEKDRPDGGKTGDKLHKRLLPTPTMAEANQLFRVKSKSKSVSNIANRSMPVKPTHMTISEITRITMEDTEDLTGVDDGALNQSEGELTHQLLQESSRRKQATELVQQLQKEYDSLLSKYALAELTIDQMRLGARITLHVDSPTPLTAKPGLLSTKTVGSKAGIMQLPQSAQRAVVLGPSFDSFSDGQSVSSTQVQTADFGSLSLARSEKGQNTSVGPGVQILEDVAGIQEPAAAEAFKLQIKQQATILNDRLDHFHALLETRQLTMEEQEKAFENIRSDHEKLRRTYLQAKEDYKLMRRSGAASEVDFDSNKELEGQLFRLGMKFDEVHENVDSYLQQQPSRRQPFQANRLPEDKHGGDTSVQQEKLVEGKSFSGAAGAAADAEYEKQVEHLHEDYRALMDHYRHLKQSPPSPETAKEMDNVVRKLNGICDEMPDMFRLPPEVQERYERLHNRDQSHSDQSHLDQSRSHLPRSEEEGPGNSAVYREERSSHLSIPHNSSKVRGLPVVGDHSISSYLSGQDRILAGRLELDDSFRRIPSSLSGSRSSLTGDHNSSITGLRSSVTPSPQDQGGRDSPSSLEGAAAPKNREGYGAHINRPRRHQHDFRDPKLTKLPDRGSLSSLPDSGISDQEGRERRTDDRLAHLPGPGKMKQMTKQRSDNDMDSGFVGSVVSTGSGAQNINRDYQPEGPLRLRERPSGDRAQNRARLDSSGSSSAVESLQRGSGRSDLSSRKLPTTAALSMQRHQDSIDRSYDAELDESTTLSEGREVDPGTNAMNRLRPQASKPLDGKNRQITGRSKDDDGSVSSQNSRSSRSARLHSSSIQDDETLEDFSNDELSTPRQLRPTHEPHAKQPPPSLSTQESHSSLLLANRPPTPHSAGTPQRPPTPYRLEEKKDNSKTTSNPEEKEDGEEEEGDASAEVIRTVERSTDRAMDRPADRAVDNQVSKTQSHSHQVSKQQVRSRSPAPTLTAAASLPQRPQSRGEPTTDLYHTRRHSHDRSQGSITSAESSKPSSVYSQSREKSEDRGVGSDIEIRSDVTHGSSVNSARLRALQEEIEKLKEGVRAANDKASERPMIQPTLAQPQPQKDQGPDYYDPFDDPYGFMRVPRRRANSFSGGRVREFDDWYLSLPNGRNEDDIPLGYAAADAYNRHHRHKPPETGRERLHQRRSERERRRRGGEGNLPKEMVEGQIGVVQRGGEREATGLPTTATLNAPAAPTSAHVRRLPVSDPQALYNYYVPTRQGMAPSANPYRQHTTPLYSSQPNLAQTLAGVAPDTYQHYASAQQQLQQPQPQWQSQPQPQQQEQKRPWYTIRRSPWSVGAQSVQYLPAVGSAYQQQNLSPQQDTAAAAVAPEYYYYSSYPSSGSTTSAPSIVGYRTESCPLCGGSGAHIHEEDVEPVHGYIAQDFATQPGQGRNSRPRQRSRSSRSLSRTRRYSAERSSSRSRYLMREYGDSASDDSEFEIVRSRRRSRSLSRSRSQSESRSSSRHRGRRKYDFDEDVDLNQSLLLSEDIGRLTHRMIGTVKGELQRHRDKLSSSHW